MEKTDKLFSQPLNKVEDFRFDDQVADVFPDMISRSVPGYDRILKTIEQLSERYAQPDTRIYDLGCSLGAASLAAAHGSQHANPIFAIDNSAAMLQRCQRYIRQFSHAAHISLFENDITQIEIEDASVVIMNFTLQFVEREKRQALIQRIADGLVPGGILILSEKIRHPDAQANELLVDLHHQFKRDNGYSELEISQKRAALENVMQLNTFSEHESRLLGAGFHSVVITQQQFNFCSMVAIKA
ncbi:carboxy-S-adenosyl-L-methionine synthase CmoA [Alteromonas facilis]|uniref:carboxy-S-adenosyl-L-methionine synthase CmoA n=1 Tax=Alteromonas facilis TaxID=2048004 RepID=UPI000C2921AF|nr:carboxy-S-adenosyl-L-methionine synthase CmoA [Alteromonas facilis]